MKRVKKITKIINDIATLEMDYYYKSRFMFRFYFRIRKLLESFE